MTAGDDRAPRRLVLDVGAVAHGGHFVARHEGQVVFVRHALPGERVEAEVTGSGNGGRFLRADAVRVLAASPDRVAPPCPYAGPGRCGGCDFQHVALPAQRHMKAEVLAAALRHQGGVDSVAGRPVADALEVRAVPGDADGLRWRTRVTYRVAVDGRLGLFRHASHEVEPVEDCLLATEALAGIGVTGVGWGEAGEVLAVAAGSGERLVDPLPPLSRGRGRAVLAALPDDVAVVGVRGRGWVTEQAAGRSWRVAARGFWQVHPGAADVLVATVRELLAPRAGETLWDLYSGVGLFAGSLAGDLGPQGRVEAVEASARAVADARRNLHDLPTVRLHHARVSAWLRGAGPRTDLVVLDPPRRGAGAAVLREVVARAPRAVAYVACDPLALARDVRTLRGLGWELAALRAFDLFPMTHHLEAVALFVPGSPAAPGGRPGVPPEVS